MPRNVLDKVGLLRRRRARVGPRVADPLPRRRAGPLRRSRGFRVRAFTSMVYAHKPGMAAWLNRGSRLRLPRAALPAHVDLLPRAGRTAVHRRRHRSGDTGLQGARAGRRLLPADPLLTGVWDSSPTPTCPWSSTADRVRLRALHRARPGRRDPGPLPVATAHRRPHGHDGVPGLLDLAERYENVGLDTTMSFTDFAEVDSPYPRDALPRVKALGDKVFWGSDYPNIPYPYAHGIEALIGLDLGDDWLPQGPLRQRGPTLRGLSRPCR